MKRRCLLIRRWHWFAVLVVPFLAWGIVLAVVPTGWARDRLVGRLVGLTGRSVRIGALRLGVLGDLRIIDLAIAEPSSPEDPWLRVGEAKIDVHLGQILTGQCEPKEIEVEGGMLRIWRRADGSTEVGDLLADRSTRTLKPATRASGGPSAASPQTIALRVSGATVRWVDEPSGTRLDLTEVEARGTWGGRLVSVEQLRGKLNGGTIALAAKVDRDPAGPRFEGEVRAIAVEIDRGMPMIGHFVPVVAGSDNAIGGKVDLQLALEGRGTTCDDLRRSLRGRGSVVLDPIDLEGSKFLAQLDVLGDWPRESRIASVTTDFRVARGRITTQDLTIQTSRFPFVLGGWTDFDGHFDYSAEVDLIAAKLPKEARGWVSDLKVHFEQLSGLRIRGTIDDVEVTVHGHPLTGDPDRTDDERARFRETARRIRDRFFR